MGGETLECGDKHYHL